MQIARRMVRDLETLNNFELGPKSWAIIERALVEIEIAVEVCEPTFLMKQVDPDECLHKYITVKNKTVYCALCGKALSEIGDVT
jgi:hypothetical protein